MLSTEKTSVEREPLPTLSLETIIRKHLWFTTFVLIVLIMVFYVVLDISAEKDRTLATAEDSFTQIESIMEKNALDKQNIEDEYYDSSITNAKAVAYILEKNPDAASDNDELKKIAELCEVEEIHIFDETGTIVYGTVPEYIGYSFDSGVQMSYFEPLLEDKSLEMVQEPTPNTAEGKNMQYTALWSEDGTFIVQIGMSPDDITKATAKNELSYIFAQMQANPNITYYAIDKQWGKIVGSSDVTTVGGKFTRLIGQNIDLSNLGSNMVCTIDGERTLCVFHEMDDKYIIYSIPTDEVYKRLPRNMLSMAASLILAVVLIFMSINNNLDTLVVHSIDEVNDKLRKITRGYYFERVDVGGSEEFEELSKHINAMVSSILTSDENLAYALSTSDMRVATYQYTEGADVVQVAGRFTSVLPVTDEELKLLTTNPNVFRVMIDDIKAHPYDPTDFIYHASSTYDRFIKLKEKRNGDTIFGVIIDMTDNIMSLRKAERERDTDILTGIANRRGMDAKIQELIARRTGPELCAIVMIDVDGLKCINDNLGHRSGDKYISTMASLLKTLEPEMCFPSRQGGDEFVLLLHDVDQADIDRIIAKLETFNDTKIEGSEEGLELRFSYGVAVSDNINKYSSMFTKADNAMYENKKARKAGRL